ncbi:MAG: hypothetical protein ACHP7N_18165, partial [Caulobacterales bacterium]
MAVFNKDLDTGAWLPSPLARGPFAGLQGGAVAGLLTAEIERLAEAESLGRAVDAAAWFLRPAPCEPLHSRVSIVHARGRLALIDNILFADDPGQPFALVRVTLLADRALQLDLPPPGTRAPIDPEPLPIARRAAPHGGPWFMDAMEARRGEGGVTWFRLKELVV